MSMNKCKYCGTEFSFDENFNNHQKECKKRHCEHHNIKYDEEDENSFYFRCIDCNDVADINKEELIDLMLWS